MISVGTIFRHGISVGTVFRHDKLLVEQPPYSKNGNKPSEEDVWLRGVGRMINENKKGNKKKEEKEKKDKQW